MALSKFFHYSDSFPVLKIGIIIKVAHTDFSCPFSIIHSHFFLFDLHFLYLLAFYSFHCFHLFFLSFVFIHHFFFVFLPCVFFFISLSFFYLSLASFRLSFHSFVWDICFLSLSLYSFFLSFIKRYQPFV